MTPTQLEHLKRIDAHLERLLDIASKRTLGKWRAESSRAYCADESVTHNVVGPPSDFMYLQELPDAIYIAACAGNAEAGWRATRVAIAALSKIAEEREPVEHGDCGNGPYVSMFRTSAARFAEQELESILAAFPLETLK